MRCNSRSLRSSLLHSLHLASFVLLVFATTTTFAKDVKTLQLAAPAPELNLPGVDGKTYRLADFSAAKVLVVLFTCNHCPTAQAYEQRIIQLHVSQRLGKTYQSRK